MATWKNTSESTFERPGDGEDAPGWSAGPGDTVEADQNPAPGSFEPVGGDGEPDPPPAEVVEAEPEPVAEGEQ